MKSITKWTWGIIMQIKKNKTIQGKQFMCKTHDLDYRICCEECQEKYKKFFKLTMAGYFLR